MAQPSNSEIFLYEIKRTPFGIILKSGTNITNSPGYDNQPFFSPDNKLMYFTSVREGVQSDIYIYNLGNKKLNRFTNSNTSEYSPTITPDKKYLSVVMVEADSTQRVWTYDLKTLSSQCITPTEDSIGYYTWIGKDSMLFYKLTDPHSLRSLDLKSGHTTFICEHPTRSFRVCNKRKEFVYGIKTKEGTEVRKYDPVLKQSLPFANLGKELEDFIWDEKLGLIKSDGTKLMRYVEEHKTWAELADLSSTVLGKITRFAISPNGRYLAVVSNQK
jgi:dipeptidyl aminopeptidase/acylaminoacyl peptidase